MKKGVTGKTADEWYEEGRNLYRARKYNEAYEAADRAIELKSDYLPSYYYRGRAREELGDQVGGETDYKKAISLPANTSTEYRCRGGAKICLKDYKGALDDLNRAIELNPNDAEVFFIRGVAKHELNDHKGALADYDQAIKMDPNDEKAYYNRGNAKFGLRDFQGAVADHTQAIKLNPNYEDAYYNRGLAQEKNNDKKGAIKDYQEYIRKETRPKEKEFIEIATRRLEELGAEVPASPKPKREKEIAPFWHDDPHEDRVDCLSHSPDVSAMSLLISSRDLPPPLSIGLFGDWGSGKSFFMRKLEKSIDNIPSAYKKKACWPNIAQIRFNAWHYIDTDLWASLVCHIFDQLNEKIVKVEDTGTGPEKALREAYENLEIRKEARAAAEKRKARAEKMMGTLTQKLENTRSKKDATKTELDTAKKDVVWGLINNKFGAEVGSIVTSALKMAGEDEKKLSETDAKQVFALLQRYNNVSQKSWELAKAFGKWQSLGAPGGIGAITLASLGGISYSIPQFSDIIGSAAPVVTFLTTAATWIAAAVPVAEKVIGPLETALEAADKVVAKGENERAERISLLESDLREQEAEFEKSEKALEAINKEVDAANAEIKEIKEGKIIAEYIAGRHGSDDYRKRLGIVATVRKDFENLAEKIAVYNGKTEYKGINRIVLYIDDLDRCPADKVVDVLQAVHLLLAFKLFVVVVAVDARWLTSSLKSQYGEMLANNYTGKNNEVINGEDEPIAPYSSDGKKATPFDYLEKIFQIPYWVNPMDDKGTVSMLNAIFGKDKQNVMLEKANGSTYANGSAIAGDKSESQPEGTTGEHSETYPKGANGWITIIKTIEKVIESQKLTEDEMSAMRTLAPIIGRSPRTVTRYINTYRLLKAAVPDENNDMNGLVIDSYNFRAPMFLLAIIVGMPELVIKYLEEIEGKHEDSAVDTLQTLTEAKNIDNVYAQDLHRIKRFSGFLGKGEGNDTAFKDIKIKDLKKWRKRVAQFSFSISPLSMVSDM